MYEIDQGWWFVPNPLNKFTVSPRNDLEVQHGRLAHAVLPERSRRARRKEANWLPAPKGDFIPMLRMYWPKETAPSILDGTWTPPAVVKTQ